MNTFHVGDDVPIDSAFAVPPTGKADKPPDRQHRTRGPNKFVYAKTTGALLAALLLVVSEAAIGLDAPPAAAARTFVVWVAPNGSDARTATSQRRPVASLDRAQEILFKKQHKGPVSVKVARGIYREWGTVWKYRSRFSTTISAYNGTPTFTGGKRHQDYGLVISPQTHRRTDMNLKVRGLRWTDAANGIRVLGASGVHLDKLRFARIGSSYSSRGRGFAALSIYGSTGTKVTRPNFRYLRNDSPYEGRLHAIYIAHSAHKSRIIKGSFSRITGDPIRVRDGSHSNSVEGGTFARTGKFAVFSEWYDIKDGEKRSTNNRIVRTNAGRDYAGRIWIPAKVCFAGSTKPVAPCGIRAYGNF